MPETLFPLTRSEAPNRRREECEMCEKKVLRRHPGICTHTGNKIWVCKACQNYGIEHLW